MALLQDFNQKCSRGPFHAPRSMRATVLLELCRAGLATRQLEPLEGIVIGQQPPTLASRLRGLFRNKAYEGRTPHARATTGMTVQVHNINTPQAEAITARLNVLFGHWPRVAVLSPTISAAKLQL